MFINNGFQLSRNGREVVFGYDYGGKEPAHFSLADLILSQGRGGSSHLSPKTGGLNLRDWRNNYFPTLNGTRLPLEQHETSRSRAIAPDEKSFLLGTEWYLRSFDSNGKLLWKQFVPGAVWAVNISANGRLAVAAYGDGTIRWYRYSDGKPLLSFFPHKDKKRWVAWTPSGYYAVSAGGDELIGWHLNHGRDKAADFFPASKFRSVYYRPDVVQKILETLDEDEALKQANAASNKHHQHVDIKDMLPPVVMLLSPQEGSSFSTKNVTLRYRLETPSGEPVTAIKALIDGVAVSTPKGMERKKRGEGSLTLPVPERDCEIALIAENKYSASVPATLSLHWEGRQVLP